MSSIALPRNDAPRVSIIVLTRRDVEMLRRCLTALSRNLRGDPAAEVIVLLNGADDEVVAFCERDVAGARVERSRVNLGFPGGCNLAAGRARGEFLVFLNDDAEVAPGWLESLVQSADEHPRAGAIGSRLLFADGSVQEAGAVVWRDGTTAQVGRERAPGRRRYACLRRVDYGSAASLLVRRSTWDAVGGFDEEYFPGYYEDVDLCLAIRSYGQEVLYEPRARVVHHVSPPDPDVDAGLFQRNAARLRAKWSTLLTDHESWEPHVPGAVERAVLRAQGWPRRVLVIGERLPGYGEDAAAARIADAIGELRAIAAVTVWASRLPDDAWHLPRRLGYDLVDGDVMEHLAAPEIFCDAVLVSGPDQLRRCMPAVRALQPQAAVIYDAGAASAPPVDPANPLTPDAVTGREPTRSWIDVFARARSRRVDEYV